MTEAVQLMDAQRITQAEVLLDSGEVITSACAAYPQALLTHLGRVSPPVLWLSEPSMATNPPWQDETGNQRFGVGGVGCRQPPRAGILTARTAGGWCADRGYFGVSGAAMGCDTVFADGVLAGGGDVVHLLPCGMNHGRWIGYAISVCPPNEPFSAGRAMERNSLIYAMSYFTLVCSARFRIGGSWQGAAAAIKNHQAIAVADWSSAGYADCLDGQNFDDEHQGSFGAAQRALVNLGAYRLPVNLALSLDEMLFNLDDAMAWATAFRAGAVNSGLFTAVS